MNTKPLNCYVYFILFLHGIVTLLSWNMFITANDYFVKKLDVSIGSNGTDTSYTQNFLSCVGIASKLPNVAVQALNFIVASSGEAFKFRILGSIAIEAVVFIITAIFVLVDMSDSPGVFFYFTMTSVVLINVADGIFQNCIFGIVARFPRRYMNALTTGMNASGVVSTTILITSMMLTADLITSSFVYFMIAVVFLAICFITYILLLKNPFFMAHTRPGKGKSMNYTEYENLIQVEVKSPKLKLSQVIHVFKKCYIQLFNLFALFATTLLVFPPVLANVSSVDGFLGRYFGVICCFLNFNSFAIIGNLLADYLPLMNKKYLLVPVLARIIFVPFFLFCNFNSNTRSTLVYFNSDWLFIMAVAIFAISQGYFSSLAIIFAPRSVQSEFASTAGMMASFSIMVGIMTGIAGSFAMPRLV